MIDRLINLIKTFIIGCLLWSIGSFALTGLVSFAEGIYYFLTEGYGKMELSPLEALFQIVPMIVQGILGMPFLLAYAFRWGILHYWYIGGSLSGIYLIICIEFSIRRTSKLLLAIALLLVQIVAYVLLGTPIDYRDVGIGEHIAYYFLPMTIGTFLTYYYARRTVSQ